MTAADPDDRPRAVLPQVAALIIAVTDEDPTEVERILSEVTDWPALAVVLAANVDDSQPIGLDPRRSSDTDVAREVIAHASAITGIGVNLILSERRDRLIADARAVAMHTCWRAGLSYAAIARSFKRDHKTVMHAVTRVGENPQLRGIAGRVATAAWIVRPADEPDKPEHRRTVQCGCGVRTTRADGRCQNCEASAA